MIQAFRKLLVFIGLSLSGVFFQLGFPLFAMLVVAASVVTAMEWFEGRGTE